MTWENRVIFEVSSADPDSDSPVWVDLTLRVRDVSQVIDVNIGRSNDLEVAEPTQWTILLDNADDALTYGSPTSPYPWWGPGRKCRLRERIGSSVVDIATGYLQTPTESLTTVGIEQRVEVSIVDRLGRFESSEPFISTLAAHIRYVGGAGLVGYWHCTEDSVRFLNVAATAMPAIAAIPGVSSTTTVPTAGVSAVVSQASPRVIADDAAPVQLTASTGLLAGLTSNAVSPDMRLEGSPSQAVLSGQIVTMVMWLYAQMPADRSSAVFLEFSDSQTVGRIRTTATDGTMTLTLLGPTLTASIAGRVLPDQAWTPVAIRYGWDTALIQFWVGRDVYTGVLAGVPVAPNFLTTLNIARFYSGGFGHVQLYVGSATDFTNAMFVDQYVMAQTALERQSTGDRITTVLKWAGVRGGEMNIDTGTSVMQRAALAGQTPLDGIRDAERTEQGLLYVDGAGITQFRDRRSLYNI